MSKKKKKRGLWKKSNEDPASKRLGAIKIDEKRLLRHPKKPDENAIPPPMCLSIGQDSGFYFGRSGRPESQGYAGMRRGEDGNILVIGGNGSGKSAGIAKPTLETYDGAICAVDVKGELSELYEELYHSGRVSRPYIIFDPTDPESISYDPFGYPARDSPDKEFNNIQEIAYAIVPVKPNEKDYFWTDTERALVAAALTYYSKLGLSLSEAICQILMLKTSELCEKLCQCEDAQITMLLGEAASMRGEVLAAIDRGMRNKLAVFAVDDYISHAFRGTREGAKCFTWDDLNEYNIFLRIPADKIEQWGGAINLMLTQLIRYFERRPDKFSPKAAGNNQTLLLIDEFARFGKLEMITSALATLRSKSVNICLIIQSVSQLDKIYGEHDRGIIFDNCQYLAILRVTERNTQEYLADLIGTCIRRQHGVGQQMDASMDTMGYSQQISEVREYRIFPHEFATLEDVILLTPYGFCRMEKLKPGSYLTPGIRFEKTLGVSGSNVLASIDDPACWFYRSPRNKGATMLTTQERADNARKRVEASEHEKRMEQKRQREEKKKIDVRRKYIVGELVIRYFPKLAAIEPGAKDENEERFARLENFLRVLASEEDLVRQIEKKAWLCDPDSCGS